MVGKRKIITKSGAQHRVDTGTLGKALSILDVVASHPKPLRFTDLLAKSHQPRGTLHRHVQHLIAEGLLELNANQTYDLGVRALYFAAQAWRRNRLRDLADPYMRELNKATQETIHLGLLNGREVIYIDKLESPKAVRMHSQIGNVSPVYCTGVGKAALACLDPLEAMKIAKSVQYKAYTDHTITSWEALIKEVADIRKRGIAYDREEHEAGIFCIAAPIPGPNGRFAAGISITMPAYRVQKRQIAAWEKLIKETAHAIAEAAENCLGPRG